MAGFGALGADRSGSAGFVVGGVRLPEAYWAPITTLVITQSSLGAALTDSWQRFMGTALGAVVGATAASYFEPHLLVFASSVFIPRIALRCAASRTSGTPLWGNNIGDCDVGAAHRSCLADGVVSIR